MKTTDAVSPFESFAQASTPTSAAPAPTLKISGYVPDHAADDTVRKVKVEFGSIFWPIVAAWGFCGVVTAIVIAIARS